MFNVINILSSEILPAINGTLGASILNGLAAFGLMFLQGLAIVGYTLIKFALNIIDFMQLLVQKLAGIDTWMHLDKLNFGNLQETDVVFRFLLSDTVLKVFRTMFLIFIVLLIVFTIFAIIKNEYSNAVDSADNNHKKSLYTAVKAIFTVIIVPFILIVGIISSNAILASIAKAFNINGNLSMGGQIFVASAYDASSYRMYANDGNRKYTSNRVNFNYTVDGQTKTATVSSAIPLITPKDDNNTNYFKGYMFTFNGKDFYLWQCEPSESEQYYVYLKFILGAYVVESEPTKSHPQGVAESVKDYNVDAKEDNNEVLLAARKMFESINSEMKNENGMGITNGFFGKPLHSENGTTEFIAAAYNTWSYNQVLNKTIGSWQNNNSLKDSVGQFMANNGQLKEARIIANNDNWGKLHDGGTYGFAPLAVEYLAMADVIDFMMQYNLTLYFVNSTNANINWNYNETPLDYGTRYTNENGEKGLLVDYKTEGRIAYQSKNVRSEVDGATYIVCYYNPIANEYVPIVNNQYLTDASGNRYKFSSSQYSADYNGAVIARAMFKASNKAKECTPTYISSTLIADSTGKDFDSKLKVAASLDFLSTQYNYLQQVTNVDNNNISLNQTINSGDIILDNSNLLSFYNNVIPDDLKNIDSVTLDNLYSQLYLEYNKENFINQNITTKLIDFFKANLKNSKDETIEYDLFDSNANYLEKDLENNLTGNIVLNFKQSNKVNPTKYTIKLSFLNESSVDSVNGKLNKVNFKVDLSWNGEEQSPVFIKIDRPHSIDDLPASGGFLTTNGNSLLNYNIATDDKDGGISNNDELFYMDGSLSIPNINNIENLVNLTVDALSLDGLNGQRYKIVATSDGNYTYDSDKKEIYFYVYKNSGSSVYDNSEKYFIKLKYTSYNYIYYTEEIDETNEILHWYKVHGIDATIYDSGENPVLNAANTIVPNRDTIDKTNAYYFGDKVYIYGDSSLFDNLDTEILNNNALNVSKYISSLVFDNSNSKCYIDLANINTTMRVNGSLSDNFNITYDLRIFTNRDGVYIVQGSDEVNMAATTSNYYTLKVTLNLVGLDNDTAKPIYEYVFDVDYSVLNSFYMLSDSNDGTNNYVETNNGKPTAINVNNLQYVGTKQYEITGLDDSKKETQLVYQFKYVKTSGKKTYSYIFNAIKTELGCDNGYTFICTNLNQADNNGWVDSFDYCKEEELVYKVGNLRAITVADFAFVVSNSENKSYYFIDTVNTSPDSVWIYKIEITNQTNIVDKNGNLNLPVTIYKDNIDDGSIVSGEKYSELESTAKAYIADRINLDTYLIGMDQFASYTAGETTGITNITLVTNSDETIIIKSDLPSFAEKEIYEYFCDHLVNVNISGTDYRRITSAEDGNKQILKLKSDPTSVVFCRDELSTAFMFDFAIHLFGGSDGFKFYFRAPKFGLAQKQSNGASQNNAIITLSRGGLMLDYNFSGKVNMLSVYQVANFNWIILIFASVLVFHILGNAVWGLIKRIYEITLLFLIMPAVASTLPIDPKGDKFGKWKNQLVSQVLGAWGVTIGLNFFFILMPVIRSASAIFTDADVAGLSSSVKFFAGNADRLNMLVYILFLLVSFTLLKTVPKMVSDYVGGSDVISEGASTKKATFETVDEATKTASGKGLIEGAGNLKKTLTSGQLIPGSELAKKGKDIYNKYKDKKAKKENQTEEERRQENMQLAEADRNNQRARAEELEKRRQALDDEIKIKDGEATNDADLDAEAEAARVAGRAGIAEGLGEGAEDQVDEQIDEKLEEKDKADDNEAKPTSEADSILDRANLAADTAAAYADEAKLSADMASGNVHDYVGDREKAEEEDRLAHKGRSGKALTNLEDAQDEVAKNLEAAKQGKAGRSKLSDEDIARWNSSHGKNEQIIAGDKSRDQKLLKARAEQEKYHAKLQNKADKAQQIYQDAQNGIYRGLRGSFVRGVLSGKKTTDQRIKDAENAQQAQQALTNAKNNKELADNVAKNFDFSKVTDENFDKMSNQLFGTAYGKQAFEAYDKFMQKQDGRTDLNTKKAALQEATKAIMEAGEKDVDKKTKASLKADKIAVDDRSGVGHFVGLTARGAGRVVAAKGATAANWLRNTGIANTVLGYSDAQKDLAKTNVDKANKEIKALSNKIINERTSMSAELKELDLLGKQKFANGLIGEISDRFKGTKKPDTGRKADYKQAVKDIDDAISAGLVDKATADMIKKVKGQAMASGKKNDSQFIYNKFMEMRNASKSISTAELNAQIAAKEKSVQAKQQSIKNSRAAMKDLVNKRNGDLDIIGSQSMAKTAKDMASVSWKLTREKLNSAANSKGGQIVKWISGYGEAKVVGKVAGKLARGAKDIAMKPYKASKEKENIRSEASKISATQFTKVQKQVHDKNVERQNNARKVIVDTIEKRQNAANDKVFAKLVSKAEKLKEQDKEDLLKLVEKSKKGQSMTAGEQKRLQDYINRYAAVRDSKLTSAKKNTVSMKNAVANEALKAYSKSINEIIKKELATSKVAGLDNAAIAKKISEAVKKNKFNPQEIQRLVSNEVNKVLREKKKIFVSGSNDDKLLQEIKQLKSIADKLKKTDNKYYRTIKNLQEANRKLSKQVKNQKSKSALEQSTRVGGNFGDNASGK